MERIILRPLILVWLGEGIVVLVLCAVLSRSAVSDCETPWTVAHQAPLSMGILQARILDWAAMPSSRGSSQPRDQTQVSCTAGGFFTVWVTKEVQVFFEFDFHFSFFKPSAHYPITTRWCSWHLRRVHGGKLDLSLTHTHTASLFLIMNKETKADGKRKA